MKKIAVVALALSGLFCRAQSRYPLYNGAPPGNLTDTVRELSDGEAIIRITQPEIEVVLPKTGKGNGTGLVIFPGGAYTFLSWKAEGTNIARLFSGKGITCFIVKYRLPDPRFFAKPDEVAQSDAIAAMRWVKARLEQYHLDPEKIGTIGFSAGGHVAASLGNHAPGDALPDFQILFYPVISMEPGLTHPDSRKRLLGEHPSAERVTYYSNELQVNAQTPPTFLLHAGDDGLVPVDNSIRFYQAMIAHHRPAQLLLPQKGNHGFIFGAPLGEWFDPVITWMKKNNWYTPDIDGSGKTVVLTFDDAPASHYSVIPGMLKAYHFGATFYVCEFPPNYADSSKYMTWHQIAALSKMGYEIGNHTWHHKDVKGMNDSTRNSEVGYIDQQCKRMGIPKPTSFCYPAYGTDSAFLPTLKKYHYTTARTGGDVPWYPHTDHPYYVPSFTIAGNNPTYFYSALEQAAKDNVIVFCIHGVPDLEHPWVNTPPAVFKKYLQYLYDHHFTVRSMREEVAALNIKR